MIARGQLPSGFTRREIHIPPGSGRAYDAAEWTGALVFIRRGAIELEGLDGRRSRFGAGSILHLDRLPLRYIRNDGFERAVLIAVGRGGRAYTSFLATGATRPRPDPKRTMTNEPSTRRRPMGAALRGFANRLLQVIALYAPGATTTRVWLHRLRGVRVGEGTFIGTAAIIETDRPELVTIGRRVNIGIRAVVIAHFWDELGVEIGDDAFIGPGAIIMPNTRIGAGAVVTAGSVVNRSVPDLTMVRGNPAEPIARCTVPLGLSTPMDEFMRGLRPIRPKQKAP